MSLESSLEALAGALQAHAGALEKLAAAMAVRGAANAERFDRSDRSPAERERDDVRGTAQDWEAGGCEDVEKDGIPVKPGEDPSDPPFEAPAKAAETLQKAKHESAPVAEQAAAGKISEEKPQAFSLADARSKATALLKNRGADALRGLLDSVGVKKLSALTAEQVQIFCANADKALKEA
jgi:hypothetical protein